MEAKNQHDEFTLIKGQRNRNFDLETSNIDYITIDQKIKNIK